MSVFRATTVREALSISLLLAALVGLAACGEAEAGPSEAASAGGGGGGAPAPAKERALCSGADAFTFQRVNAEAGWQGSAFGILWRNGYAYLRVDGHCNYYAYDLHRNDPIVTGVLTGAEAQALAAETGYATWPSYDGLVANGGIFDASTEVLNDGWHELFCRQGCRDLPAESDVEAARVLEPMLDAADAWRDRLLARGVPLGGSVRFAVAIQNEAVHGGVFLEWPLATPIEAYAVDPTISKEDEDYDPITTGYLAEGEDAAALRALRAQAVATALKGSQTEGWISIDAPGDTFYEVVVADVLPYEDETGVVPRRFSQLAE